MDSTLSKSKQSHKQRGKYKTNVLSSLASLLLLSFSAPTLAGWEVQWIDKFEGNSVNWGNWTAQTAANYNNEEQCYTDDDSSAEKNYDVSNGTLKIIARKQSISCPGLSGTYKNWTSGRLNSKDKQEFLYGRIESRIRFLNLETGTWPAFWMLENRIAEQPIKGDDDSVYWPNKGASEIDVWEWHADQPNRYITNFFNGENNCGSLRYYQYPNGGIDVTQWHKYALEWNKDQIDFYVINDSNQQTLVSSQDMSNCSRYEESMFVLLNVAMGGDLGGYIDPSLDKATMEVDYVAHCTANDESDSAFCDENTYNQDDYLPSMMLNVEQNGQLSNTINPANGVVTITAKTSNLDAESSYNYSWYSARLPSPIENENKISFDPVSMSDGNYYVSLTLTDEQNSVLTTRENVTVKVSSSDSPSNPTLPDDKVASSSGGSVNQLLLSCLALLCLFRRRFNLI